MVTNHVVRYAHILQLIAQYTAVFRSYDQTLLYHALGETRVKAKSQLLIETNDTISTNY